MFGLGMALDQIARIAGMSAEEVEQMMKKKCVRKQTEYQP